MSLFRPFRPFVLAACVLTPPLVLGACKGTDLSGNPTVAADAPGSTAGENGPTIPGNVVPTIGGGAGNGGGVSGGGAGVGNGH